MLPYLRIAIQPTKLEVICSSVESPQMTCVCIRTQGMPLSVNPSLFGVDLCFSHLTDFEDTCTVKDTVI